MGLRNRLKAIAEPLIVGIDPKGPEGIAARSRVLEAFLRDSGQFSYTLQMEIADHKLDPVEDFLINRKRGHCEYFASALALLLRSVSVRSRMVNGFKGGDWNQLTGTLNVRQKHAHSWVEAYTGKIGPDGTPVWITLDPTPVADRKKSIAQVGGLAGKFRPLTDSLRHIWIFYVVGYDGDRQEKLIYGPNAHNRQGDKRPIYNDGCMAQEMVRAALPFPGCQLIYKRSWLCRRVCRRSFISRFRETLVPVDPADVSPNAWASAQRCVFIAGNHILPPIRPYPRRD